MALKLSKIEIQHEFDNEPTYVVGYEQGQASSQEGLTLAELSPSLPYKLRLQIAAQIKDACQGLITT